MPASSCAMVHLDVDGEASVLQSFEEMVLPLRPTAIKRDGVQLRDQRPQFLHAAGFRRGGVTDAVVEVDLVFDDQTSSPMDFRLIDDVIDGGLLQFPIPGMPVVAG